MKQLSLRPYPGILFVAKSKKDYERAHKKLFKSPDVLSCEQAGRFAVGEGKRGMLTYLVYGGSIPSLCHELSHVVLHLFEYVGIDPRESLGEPFCYMLSQLVLEAK